MASSTTPDSANEQARLEALRRYAILDTPPEREFDDLAARAARDCGYSTAFITLMSQDRCWFKAVVGAPPANPQVREIPREESLCNHAFRSSGILVVPDARADVRFRHLPIIARPGGYRAYAGAQLITPDGHSIGTVCVLDTAPRTPTPRQVDALRVIATRVMALLESRQSDLAPATPVSVGAPRAAAAPPVPSAPPFDSPRAIVLIVDDEDLVRGVTAAIVARLGYETRLAANGQEALDRIAALDGRVRLVITDVNMPLMDGLELARVLRRQPNVPAIAAMSGRFTPEIRRQLQDEGVTHFIAKPFGSEEIANAVRALLAPAR